MSQTSRKSDAPAAILEQLRNPVKLRVILSAAMIAGWYLFLIGPLNEQMAATANRTLQERKRIVTAREIDRLKQALQPYEARIAAGDDVNELMQSVIGRIRPSPMKLTELRPEKPRDLGPFDAIGLRLAVEGTFAEINRFLAWVAAEKRIWRVTSIKLEPAHQDSSLLEATIVLVSLGEKRAGPAAKSRTEAVDHR